MSLWDVVKGEDFSGVQEALKQVPRTDLNYVYERDGFRVYGIGHGPPGYTCLHYSAMVGNRPIAECLVEAKAAVNAWDGHQNTALHIAASNSQIEIVKYLVEEARASIKAKNSMGKTPLQLVTEGLEAHFDPESVQVAEYLRGKGNRPFKSSTSISKSTQQCTTSIWDLVKSEDLPGVQAALTQTPRPNLSQVYERDGFRVYGIGHGPSGYTCLHHAAENGNLPIAKCLVDAKASANAWDGHQNNALHVAASNSQLEMVKYLVEEAKASVKAKNSRGNTPLQEAMGCDQKAGDVIAYLRKKVRQPSIRTSNVISKKEPTTSLWDFVKSEDLTGVQTALKRTPSADLDHVYERDGFRVYGMGHGPPGYTCLHYACEIGNLPIVKSLIKAKANSNAWDGHQNNSLHVAASNSQMGVVRYLVEEAKVSVKARNSAGKNPFQVALESIDVGVDSEAKQIVEYLREKIKRTKPKNERRRLSLQNSKRVRIK